MLFIVWRGKEKFLWMVQNYKFFLCIRFNILRCVGNNDGNISGMKNHDSHVMMQHLFSMVMHGYLGDDVQTALIELGVFLRKLCCQKLKINLLERSEKNIVLIFYKLEKNFLLSFFYVMVHLAVHLPKKTLLAELIYYRWMYPIER